MHWILKTTYKKGKCDAMTEFQKHLRQSVLCGIYKCSSYELKQKESAMSEKTIFPEWQHGILPTKKDRMLDVVMVYYNSKIITRQWDALILDDYWFDIKLYPKVTEGNKRYIDYIATPAECEARMKKSHGEGWCKDTKEFAQKVVEQVTCEGREIKTKEPTEGEGGILVPSKKTNKFDYPDGLCLTDRIISDAKRIAEQSIEFSKEFKKLESDNKKENNDEWIPGNECEAREKAEEYSEKETWECEKCQEEFSNKDGVCPVCEHGKETNPWIPGSEPEKEGWYEVTRKSGEVSPDYFIGDNEWIYWQSRYILAHQPITLSDPYIPPESERELRCPFCDSDDYNKGEDENGIDFYCKKCKSIIRDKTKKELFEIYDKLNKGELNE